jgi:hypothetical protein
MKFVIGFQTKSSWADFVYVSYRFSIVACRPVARQRKEDVVAKFKVLSRHLPGRTEKNHLNLRIVRVQSAIRTGHRPNTSQERYR